MAILNIMCNLELPWELTRAAWGAPADELLSGSLEALPPLIEDGLVTRDDTGLRITQYSILANLDRLKSLSITELANVMVIDRTTLTRNLRPLQRDGLVALSDGPDKRSRALTLTDEGRERLKTARPLWRKTERKVRQGIDSEDLAQLRQLLARVAPVG